MTTAGTPRLGEGHRRLSARETEPWKQLPHGVYHATFPSRAPLCEAPDGTLVGRRRWQEAEHAEDSPSRLSLAHRVFAAGLGGGSQSLSRSGACWTTAVHMTRGPAKGWVGGDKVYPMSELCTCARCPADVGDCSGAYIGSRPSSLLYLARGRLVRLLLGDAIASEIPPGWFWMNAACDCPKPRVLMLLPVTRHSQGKRLQDDISSPQKHS